MNGEDDFKASEVWFNRWKKRHGIHMLTNSGEKLSANFQAVTKFKEKFENLINEKDLSDEQAYNVDETCLYFRLLAEKIISIYKRSRSTRLQKIKDRVTLPVCSNAARTQTSFDGN